MTETTRAGASSEGLHPKILFREGFRGYGKCLVPVSLAGFATLMVFYLTVALPAESLGDQSRFVATMAFAAGLILTGTVAYPWYSYALDAADHGKVDLARPFQQPKRFYYQAVASFWFWAGVALGFRYLLGIPAIAVVIMYAFHGYLIADRKVSGGLKALGVSVRLGQGNRVVLFALMALFGLFSMLGALSLGMRDAADEPLINPLTVSLAVIGLTITTSITLVAGAAAYRHLVEQLDWDWSEV
jgi:hypothetical protein